MRGRGRRPRAGPATWRRRTTARPTTWSCATQARIQTLRCLKPTLFGVICGAARALNEHEEALAVLQLSRGQAIYSICY